MNTLVTQGSHLDDKSKGVIPPSVRGYFQQRLYSRVQQLLLQLVRTEERSNANFSRRFLAKRIEKKPEQITRWLSYPGNLTLDTLCDLVLAMNCELRIEAMPLSSPKIEYIRSVDHIRIGIVITIKKSSDRIVDGDPICFGSFAPSKGEYILSHEGCTHA